MSVDALKRTVRSRRAAGGPQSSWAAINDTAGAGIARRLEPDSTKRRARQETFQRLFGSGEHRDAIYTQVLP